MITCSARQFREAGRIAKEEKTVHSSLDEMKKDEEELSASLKEKHKVLDAVTTEFMSVRKDKLLLERKEGTVWYKILL